MPIKPELKKRLEGDPSNIRDYFKTWPKFYYFVAALFGPLWWSGVSPAKFFREYCSKGTVLNLGSGPKVIDKGITNVDMFDYEGVNIVADIMNLPFKDGTVDGIICDTVLEHVQDPIRAVKEMHRVTRDKGLVYITVPFLYPFHSSPRDFTRWTHEGLAELMKDFEVVEIGVRAGPFSALTVWLCYFVASILSFGSEKLYWLFMNLSLLVFFPLKLVDIIVSKLPFAINAASVLYVIAKKHE